MLPGGRIPEMPSGDHGDPGEDRIDVSIADHATDAAADDADDDATDDAANATDEATAESTTQRDEARRRTTLGAPEDGPSAKTDGGPVAGRVGADGRRQ